MSGFRHGHDGCHEADKATRHTDEPPSTGQFYSLQSFDNYDNRLKISSHPIHPLTDLDDDHVLGMKATPMKLDHCDLLLDAIDAQLSQLQVGSC